MITQDYLKSILEYIPESGLWLWKVKRQRIHIGARAGSIGSSGYRLIKIDQKTYRSARLAFFYMKGRWPEPQIDHKNWIRNDDRWDNLREADFFLQNTNKFTTRAPHKDKKSNLPIGVTLTCNNRYMVRALLNKTRICLGTYDTPNEAYEIYSKFVKENT